MTIYNKNNINLNYLNSYVKYYITLDTLCLENTIYNKKIILKCHYVASCQLLNALKKGTDNINLLEILTNISSKPNELYKYLLQNFIIE